MGRPRFKSCLGLRYQLFERLEIGVHCYLNSRVPGEALGWRVDCRTIESLVGLKSWRPNLHQSLICVSYATLLTESYSQKPTQQNPMKHTPTTVCNKRSKMVKATSTWLKPGSLLQLVRHPYKESKAEETCKKGKMILVLLKKRNRQMFELPFLVLLPHAQLINLKLFFLPSFSFFQTHLLLANFSTNYYKSAGPVLV